MGVGSISFNSRFDDGCGLKAAQNPRRGAGELRASEEFPGGVERMSPWPSSWTRAHQLACGFPLPTKLPPPHHPQPNSLLKVGPHLHWFSTTSGTMLTRAEGSGTVLKQTDLESAWFRDLCPATMESRIRVCVCGGISCSWRPPFLARAVWAWGIRTLQEVVNSNNWDLQPRSQLSWNSPSSTQKFSQTGPQPAASVSPGNLMEMQILGPLPRPPELETGGGGPTELLRFNKPSRCFWGMLIWEPLAENLA